MGRVGVDGVWNPGRLTDRPYTYSHTPIHACIYQEATLAGNRWGQTNFRIMGIQTAKKIPKEEPCELMVIVTPGYVDSRLGLGRW